MRQVAIISFLVALVKQTSPRKHRSLPSRRPLRKTDGEWLVGKSRVNADAFRITGATQSQNRGTSQHALEIGVVCYDGKV